MAGSENPTSIMFTSLLVGVSSMSSSIATRRPVDAQVRAVLLVLGNRATSRKPSAR